MIGYTIVGTRDLEAAKNFYGPLFEQMGYVPHFADAQVASWGHPDNAEAARFFVCYPFDDQPATVGNGTMTAFRTSTASKVDELHETALRFGGTDEGAPGFRPEAYGDKFYVGYVRDPDGNKLAFACYDGKSNP